MLAGTEVMATATADPWWHSAVPSLSRVTDLPGGYADGWSFVAPVVSMPAYLDWLASRVVELGGTLTRLNLSALPDGGDVVVNCCRARRPVAGRGPLGYAGAGAGGLRGAVRPRRVVAGRRRADVRHPAVGRDRGRRHRGGGGLEPHAVAGDRGGDSRARRRRWCRSWPRPGCCGTRWGYGRPAPRCGWSERATSSTATATAAPVSPSAGAAPTRWPTWSAATTAAPRAATPTRQPTSVAPLVVDALPRGGDRDAGHHQAGQQQVAEHSRRRPVKWRADDLHRVRVERPVDVRERLGPAATPRPRSPSASVSIVSSTSGSVTSA